MAAFFSRGWRKYFVALGLIVGFLLAFPSCNSAHLTQKKSCTNTSYVRKQLTPRDVPCQTTCGLRLYGSDDCRGLQAAENRAVMVFSKHFNLVCEKLKDWNVVVQPPGFEITGWNSSAHDGGVLGLTFCKAREMQVETDDWKRSSFAHEAWHVLEWCGSVHPSDEDPHASWEGGVQEEGIRKADGL